MGLRSGLILCAPEGSATVQGGARTGVAACLSAGINCWVDSRESIPTDSPEVINRDKIISGSKALFFLVPPVHLSNCIDFS